MPYQFKALDAEAESIRLMYLLPDEPSADIRIDLVHTLLKEEDVPKYEALSYAWGETDTPEVIYVGHKGDNTIAVTRSLYQALPYLRYRDNPRVLWIDAICVDQQNLEERGHQVERMGDVYSLADRVIVWLGLDDTTSLHAIQLLRTIASKVEVDWITIKMKPVSQDDADWGDMTKDSSYSQQDAFAVHSLVMRPWFERLWVQQEIHANRNAVLICGLDTLSWHDFRKAFFCFFGYKWRTSGDDESLYPGLPIRLRLIAKMISGADCSTLGALIVKSELCKCSDPRDRVYAVLNMLKTVNSFERHAKIKPDYAKTVSQVYRDVVLSILDQTNQTSILDHCEMQEQPLGSSDSLQIPSWVPDWTIPSNQRRLNIGFASGNSSAEISHGNDVLRVMGTQVARICHVEKIVCDSMLDSILAIRDFSQKLLPDVMSASYVSGGSKLDAYCRTLCGNRFSGQYLPANALMPVFQESRECLSSILSPPETNIKMHSNLATCYRQYLSRVFYFCNGTSFFTTEEGHIGLAPRAAKPGDRVCVLLGSNSPFLLRPTGNKQYQLVGCCYTHGIMTGEAFLGPLPDDYRSVFLLNSKRNGYTRAYHSPEKGIIQWNDPRLPYKPVYKPSGGRWVEQEQKALTSKALKKRGVHMQMFELI